MLSLAIINSKLGKNRESIRAFHKANREYTIFDNSFEKLFIYDGLYKNYKVIKILKEDLNFGHDSINKLKLFSKSLIIANQKHNFISKNSELDLWERHILDSAQLVKFIDFKAGSLADLGSGAGFPGIILAIFNDNKAFHVKLYEKSPVKRKFLDNIIKELDIGANVFSNVYEKNIEVNFVVGRAFKKLDQVYKFHVKL